MSDFNAIFIQMRENTENEFDTINLRLKKAGFLFTLRYHELKSWAQAWADEAEAMPYYMENLSNIFNDRRIIGISCQSVVDAIGYWDIIEGQEKRVLIYGFIQERAWEKVEGEPQAWENEIFKGRDGYEIGKNPKIGENQPFFSNFDIQKMGELLELPGFGRYALSEKIWTKEIFN